MLPFCSLTFTFSGRRKIANSQKIQLDTFNLFLPLSSCKVTLERVQRGWDLRTVLGARLASVHPGSACPARGSFASLCVCHERNTPSAWSASAQGRDGRAKPSSPDNSSGPCHQARGRVEHSCHAFAKQKVISGIVTNPINKEVIAKKLKRFKGHTEYLAKKDKKSNEMMFLLNKKMKVIPVTTHLSLIHI